MKRIYVVPFLSFLLSCVIGFLSIIVFGGYEYYRKVKGYCDTVLNDEYALSCFTAIAGSGVWLWIITTLLY